MRIIGCDLHARQQTLAMLETTTGELANLTLMHEGSNVRKFYSSLPRPVRSRLTSSSPIFDQQPRNMGKLSCIARN
jgi:hypothetical protein